MENKNAKRKRFFCSVPGFLTLFVALLLSALCALRFGSAHLSWAEFFDALFFEQGAETDSLILYSVRLPRILAGVLAGVGLSVSGVLLQGVTDNALASPNVIGVNAGAGFGVMLTLAVLPAGLGALRFSLLPVFAFAGAFLTTLTVVLLSRRTGAGRAAIVLSGVAMSALLNALISGITGAALARQMSTDAINPSQWKLVLIGLLLTTLPPLLLGFLFYKILLRIVARRERRSVIRYFMRTQRFSAAGSALLHGAQDSQKFMGIYMLGLSLYGASVSTDTIPPAIVLICAAVMTLGTMLGGARIIKKVGIDMTELDAAGGSASDAASTVVLSFCSLAGIPASTTHSKASAIMGTGLCKKGGIDLRIAGQMLAAWALTFPFCGVIGFFLCYLISL